MSKEQEIFGGYVLETELRKSPEGVSYIAHAPDTPTQKVFVKKLMPDLSNNAAYRTLFLRDAERMKGLVLEGVLVPIAYIEENKDLGIVYPYCAHNPLSYFWRNGKRSLEEVYQAFMPIAGAIDALHERKIVHGAIHENNVVVDKSGTLTVLNAGFCREAPWMDLFPQIHCSSPEQLFEHQNTAAADRYCFGMLLYAALAGSFPWPAKTSVEESVELRRNNNILSISSFLYSIDPELLVAITKMLSFSPVERLPTCTELMNILDQAMLRVEESSELGIAPEELKRIQGEVDELDLQLSKMERKLASFETRLQQMVVAKEEGLAKIKKKTKGIQERYSPQIIAIEQKIQEIKNIKPTFFEGIQSYFSGPKNTSKEKQIKELEKEWIRLGQERDQAFQNENERIKEEQETVMTTYLRAAEKINATYEPLRDEYAQLEEKFFEYGELNPRLLGFRAKKRFSIASIKIGTIHIDMKLLPFGSFQMGDTRTLNPDPDALPLHEVSFKKAFWISCVTITQECYRSVMGKNPSIHQHPKNPVEMVSWYDAIRFCNTLSLREGLQVPYEIIEDDDIIVKWDRKANGYRLPTEAEWEYAARAGESFLYSGSAKPKEVAWYFDNSKSISHNVEKKQPNAWGLYDMSGNVWEWCWDLKEPYKKGSVVDPVGAKEGNGRIFRGGSFLVKEDILPIFHRGVENPNIKSEAVGFRVVRDAR